MPEEFEPGMGPPPEIKSGLQTAITLANQYGGIDRIPDEELEKIGYERTAEGSVAPKGLKEIRAEKQTQQERQQSEKQHSLERSLEQKAENAPFGEITVSLFGKEIGFRRLNEQNIEKLDNEGKKIVDSLDYTHRTTVEEIIQKNIPTDNYFSNFFQNFRKFLDSDELKPEISGTEQRTIEEFIFYDGALQTVYLAFEGSLTYDKDPEIRFNHLDAFIAEFKEETRGNEFILPSPQVAAIYQQLERKKGVLADRSELSNYFINNQTNPDRLFDISDILLIDKKYAKLAAYCRDRGLNNIFALGTHFFTRLLDFHQLSNISKELKTADSPKQAVTVLKAKRGEALSAMEDEEKTLRQQIKGAPIEEKKTLSGRLKKIKEMKDTQKEIIEGLIQYYNFPDLAAQIIGRNIKHLQDFLVAKKGKDEEADFILDARPNAALDRDPGAVSGDCTEGKPLPFADPKIPVYNVKVFSKDREHIGNIYLLVTSASDNEPTWHLDAIQVPQPNINWPVAISRIIAAMQSEAQKQNISMITTNDTLEGISNYDYISEAVKSYWEKQGAQKSDVSIPYSEDTNLEDGVYSSFQGNGQAKVLWKKE